MYKTTWRMKTSTTMNIRKIVELNEIEHNDDTQFVDDVSGQMLDTELVRAARAEEMQVFKDHDVYTKVLIDEAWRVSGKAPIGTRWIDINKGDDATPEYRSRLVAQEFAGKQDREDIFAATPPLFATKAVISDAASQGDFGFGNRVLQVIDVKTAFLYGEIKDKVYIETLNGPELRDDGTNYK